jgi:hypothetical protein
MLDDRTEEGTTALVAASLVPAWVSLAWPTLGRSRWHRREHQLGDGGWNMRIAKEHVVVLGTFVGVALAVMGCGQAADATEAPPVDEAPLEAQNMGWNAYPSMYASTTLGGALAQVLFQSPSPNTSRRAGVCALQQFRDSSAQPVTCNTANDCGSAPSSVPSGGLRYCAAPAGSGTKYCYFRPGSQASLCAGSPATGQPITTDAYGYSYQQAYGPGAIGSLWLSYACFEGCASSDPYVSSNTEVIQGGCFPGDQYVPPYCY